MKIIIVSSDYNNNLPHSYMFIILISYYYYYYYYILTEFIPKKKRLTQIISSRGMVINNCEKYLQIETSRLIMIAHTHVRARAHPTESHDLFN